MPARLCAGELRSRAWTCCSTTSGSRSTRSER
jgi:hypothetical protein